MALVRSIFAKSIALLGRMAYRVFNTLGELGIFAASATLWIVRRRPSPGTLIPNLYYVGVRSVPVVAVTGLFIGMVMAVQYYREFYNLGLATRLGSIIDISIVRELGPVLAATMIAGRVGSAMAAELGTMRITEQIDALQCLGANTLHYLVVPRLMSCVLLIPLLTTVADFMGIMGGGLICTRVYHVEPHFYWSRAREYVSLWDLGDGLVKSLFFGAAICLISCHRGLKCKPGAQGVGRAATEAFVASFIAILILDFVLAMFMNNISMYFWPAPAGAML